MKKGGSRAERYWWGLVVVLLPLAVIGVLILHGQGDDDLVLFLQAAMR
ncbi:hypothetical protein [Serratia marcescens]